MTISCQMQIPPFVFTHEKIKTRGRIRISSTPKYHQTANYRLRRNFALNSDHLAANNGHFLSHAFSTKGVSLGEVKTCPIFLTQQEWFPHTKTLIEYFWFFMKYFNKWKKHRCLCHRFCGCESSNLNRLFWSKKTGSLVVVKLPSLRVLTKFYIVNISTTKYAWYLANCGPINPVLDSTTMLWKAGGWTGELDPRSSLTEIEHSGIF